MEFGILGALEVNSDGARLDLGGARNQKVLAALLLSAGRVVPLQRLVDVVWDGAPPSTSKHQIHKCVADLRAAFQESGTAAAIHTDGAGYRIVLGTDRLDAQIFDDRMRDAQQAVAAGQVLQAAEELRAALALWRGPALADLGSRAVGEDADRLNERWFIAAEQCLSLELALGRHRELVPELTALVSAYPLREQLTGLLMIALHRSGRQADALEAYQRLRLRLSGELGVEPGEGLRGVHRAVLGDDTAAAPAARRVHAQLPQDLVRFTGRLDHLDEMDRVLAAGGGVVVVAGTPGVGKTALAMHWAHRVREWFPDGQLHLNLRGYDDDAATTPADALAQLLRGLGVDADLVPRDLDERAALYRSSLADRRMLILLDNAATEEQVRHLLPGCAGSAVVVTSRSDLRGLTAMDDAYRIMLDVLTPHEAYTLVAQIVGWDRADAEPGAVAELAGLCGYLPLALRIAAANLACRPGERITDFAAELAAGDRLAKLAIRGDRRAVVAAAFELSYRSLPDDARRLFRRLGLLPRIDFTSHVAAALIDESPARAAELVEVLVSVSLVEPPTRGWYRLHDLLSLYARDQARTDEQRHGARRRLLAFYLSTADAALELLTPGMTRLDRPAASADALPLSFPTKDDALSWLDDTRESLVTIAIQCGQDGPREFSWHLADALRGFFWLRSHFDDWLATGHAGLQAATVENDLAGQAAMHAALGGAHMELDCRQATDHFEQALGLYRAMGSRRGEFHCLNSLGGTYVTLGEVYRGADLLEQAYALADGPRRKAPVLANLAVAKEQAGLLSISLDYSERALACFRETEDRIGEPFALCYLGTVCADLGRLEEARRHVDHALVQARLSKSRSWEVTAMLAVAKVEICTGLAEQAQRRAQSVLDEVDDHHFALLARQVIGTTHHHLGRLEAAVDALGGALHTAQALSRGYFEVGLMTDLARALLAAGHREAATRHAENALRLAVERGYGVFHGRALATLAYVHFGHDDERAHRLAAEAHTVQLLTGHRLGRAEALLLLGTSGDRLHGMEEAEGQLRQARRIFAQHTGDGNRGPAGFLGDADLRLVDCPEHVEKGRTAPSCLGEQQERRG